MPAPVSFEEAIAAFALGFSFTRSRTHPYVAERLSEHAWHLRDAPRKSGDMRKEEFIFHDLPPVEVLDLVRRRAGARYAICVLLRSGEPDEALRAGFKDLGQRLLVTEDLFVHPLQVIPEPPEALPVVRVTTPELAERLAKAARRRQIRAEDVTAARPAQRQYVVLEGEQPVGWVGSVVTGDTCWCTNMYVQPAHRRRGLARAMLAQMLRDDRDGGARANVLLASHAGSKLYPTVGYELRGKLYAFMPRE